VYHPRGCREVATIGRHSDLLEAALARAGDAFAADRVSLGLLRHGVLDFGGAAKPDKPVWRLIGDAVRNLCPVDASFEGRAVLVVPLEVDGSAGGLMVFEREGGSFSTADRLLVDLLASHLALELDNTRLYRKLDMLFRQFMPADVADQLVSDPDQAALGGSIRDVSVLFADLRGFTSFSERSSPEQVVGLLNRYFSAAVPVIINHGGTVTTFIGDALMALFNAPALQPDHVLRAARAGLAMQSELEAVAALEPAGPRFRVGINTGAALVGNIGSNERRTYTAIGDTVNVASRLEGRAEPGEVVIGQATCAALGEVARARPLGALQVKGRAQPVEAFKLDGLHEPRAHRGTQVVQLR